MAVQEAEAAIRRRLMMVPPNRMPSIVPLTQVRLAAGIAGTRIGRHGRPDGVPAMWRRYTATARNLFTKAWYL